MMQIGVLRYEDTSIGLECLRRAKYVEFSYGNCVGEAWELDLLRKNVSGKLTWGRRLKHMPVVETIAPTRDADSRSSVLHFYVDEDDPHIVWLPWLRRNEQWCIAYEKELWEDRIRRLA